MHYPIITIFVYWTNYSNSTDPGDKEAEIQQEKEELEEQLELIRENSKADKENYLEQITIQKEAYEQQLYDQQQSYDGQIQQLQLDLEKRSLAIQNVSDMVQQYEFLVPEYSRLKRDRAEYITPPIYSKPGGYKFVIKVLVVGSRTGLGSHVSIQGLSQLGEYDANLSYPVNNMSVTLQILNQQNKKESYEKQVHFTYTRSNNGETLGSDFQFISHQQLEENAAIYLKNDTLWFRITKIQIETANPGSKK